MNDGAKIRNLVGWLAILSIVPIIGAFIAAVAALDFDFDALQDTTYTLATLGDRTTLFWWGWLLTAISFSMWVPLVMYLCR